MKEKQKYRPQNVIRFHLLGRCCVLKRPTTLPTSKDTHCNDKRFGNLPPSFRSLAFFLRSITVKSLALYEWTNGTEMFGNSGKSGKKEIPRKVLPFFRKLSTGDEPFHLYLPRNYRKFHSNGKRSSSCKIPNPWGNSSSLPRLILKSLWLASWLVRSTLEGAVRFESWTGT